MLSSKRQTVRRDVDETSFPSMIPMESLERTPHVENVHVKEC